MVHTVITGGPMDHTESKGGTWSTLGVQRDLWSTLERKGGTCSTLGVQKALWSTLGVQGDPGSTLGVQGNPWSALGVQGDPWFKNFCFIQILQFFLSFSFHTR